MVYDGVVLTPLYGVLSLKTIGIRKLPSADRVVHACLDIIVLALSEKKNDIFDGVYFMRTRSRCCGTEGSCNSSRTTCTPAGSVA